MKIKEIFQKDSKTSYIVVNRVEIVFDSDNPRLKDLIGKIVWLSRGKPWVNEGKKVISSLPKFLLNLDSGMLQFSNQVKFKDGNPLNLKLENMEVITRGASVSESRSRNEIQLMFGDLPKHIHIESSLRKDGSIRYSVVASIQIAGKRYAISNSISSDKLNDKEHIQKMIDSGLKFIDGIKSRIIPITKSRKRIINYAKNL